MWAIKQSSAPDRCALRIITYMATHPLLKLLRGNMRAMACASTLAVKPFFLAVSGSSTAHVTDGTSICQHHRHRLNDPALR